MKMMKRRIFSRPELSFATLLGPETVDFDLDVVVPSTSLAFSSTLAPETIDFDLDLPWTPPSVSGLQFWASSTMLTGLANNDPVATYTDFSGNAYDATASGTARPSYIAATPSVKFDGTNNRFSLHSSIVLGGAWTIGLSIKNDVTVGAGTSDNLIIIPCGGSTFVFVGRVNVGGYKLLSWRSKVGSSGTDATVGYDLANDTNFHRLILTYDNGAASSTGSYTAYIDGSSVTVSTSGVAGIAADTIGTIGARYAPSTGVLAPHNGPIDRCVVYNVALAGGDITSLDGYLAS